jgi:ABC-2 type transport system ATP-binding protein
MNSVEISHIVKSFGTVKAVNDVSFSVEKGTIFGLLGPNGAGKTTSIRVMLDIFRPDSGTVSILDGPMSDAKKNRIGYMPEERGLYQDIRLDRCLTYLGTLKGLSAAEARQRAGSYLERFDLAAHKHKKVKELSKGMQQKAQIITTLLHRPELIIVDEPFSGLDPVNTQMVIDLLREECDRGATILLCSHQMHQVEALCDRLVLIDHGQVMLYGRLDEIRRRYAGNAVEVRTLEGHPDYASLPGVSSVEQHNSTTRLTLGAGISPQEVLKALVAQDVFVEQFEVAMPTLDEIFIQVVQGAQE